jgi:hypothetical protein
MSRYHCTRGLIMEVKVLKRKITEPKREKVMITWLKFIH